MNIALFTDTFYPKYDGTQKVVESLATEYSLLGHNVVVVAPDYGKVNTEDGKKPYKVCRLKSKPAGGGHYRVSRFGHLFKKTKNEFLKLGFVPDIVHSFSPNEVGYAGIKFAKKNGIKSVLTMDTKFSYVFHREIPFDKNNIIHKLIFRLVLHINTIPESIKKCNALLTVAESYYKDEIIGEYKIYKNSTCIKNGIEISGFPQFDLNKILISKDCFNICYAGRIDRVKNLNFSFKVCELLKAKNIPFHFALAGDGPDLNYYKEYVKQSNMEDSIDFLGRKNIDELIELYYNSDCLLFPSIYDNDSLVAIESRFCGCPTLTIENTATRERVTDGVNGFSLPNSPEVFAEKISELYNLKQTNYDEFLLLKTNSARTPIKKWRDVAIEHINFYNN